MNPGNGRGQPSGKSADDQIDDPRSQNVGPAQSTANAHRGHDSTFQPTQHQIAAYEANAQASGKGVYTPDPSRETLAQTPVGQYMLPPPPAEQVPIYPAAVEHPRVLQIKPNNEESKICKEHPLEVKGMFISASSWIEMGGALGVRPGAVKWMWKKEMGMDDAEANEQRHKSSAAAGQRRLRENAKVSKSDEK